MLIHLSSVVGLVVAGWETEHESFVSPINHVNYRIITLTTNTACALSIKPTVLVDTSRAPEIIHRPQQVNLQHTIHDVHNTDVR